MTICQGRRSVNVSTHWRGVLFVGLILTFGCTDSTEQTVELTPTEQRQPASFTTPLTDADVQTCLNIAAAMPDGKLPEFVPLAQSTIDDRMPAERLIESYRAEYRRMFDPVAQARHWRRDQQLTQLFAAHGTTPEEFASVLTRIGCGIAARTVKSRLNLGEASAKASEQLASLISQMNTMDQQAANPRVNDIAISQRRQPLVDQLKSLVALSEFSAILSNVPPQSTDVISQHWDALASLLPEGGELEMFERTLDSPAVIVPVNHESPGAP